MREQCAVTHDPPPALAHDSNCVVQSARHEYRQRLEQPGAVAIGKNNAPAKSFWSKLKNELVHHERFDTRKQARAGIFEYVEAFYNRQRLHSAIGYVSPEQFEPSRR